MYGGMDSNMTQYLQRLISTGVLVCQFYDHFYDWGLKEEITNLLKCRQHNKIRANSKVDIKCADGDMYVAEIDNKIIVKLGPR